MDFLKALEEARQHGIEKDDFLKIWESEMKLKQQQEEAKVLELRLTCGKQDVSQMQSMKDQLKNLLSNNVKDLQQQMDTLKTDLLKQRNAHNQELKKQLESQAAATAMVIRNELESVLAHYGIGPATGTYHSVPFTYSGIQPRENSFHQNARKDDPASWNQSVDDGYSELFPSEEGALLCVGSLEQLISSSAAVTSPVYSLPDCPVKVKLSVWFQKKGNIAARVSIFGAQEQNLKVARIFNITGMIENKNSGSFSPLFEGISQPLRKLRPNKEMIVNTDVCLITAKSSFENVAYEELERRGYIINDSLIIKWFVTSEVQSNNP